MVIPQNSHFRQQWHLVLINAPNAWERLNGNNPVVQGNIGEIVFGDPTLVIASLDTGVQSVGGAVQHVAFQGTLSNNQDKVVMLLDSEAGIVLNNDDSEGTHGTEVAGLITGKANVGAFPFYNGSAVIGVAPNVKLISGSTGIRLFPFIFYLSGLSEIGNKVADFNPIVVDTNVDPLTGPFPPNPNYNGQALAGIRSANFAAMIAANPIGFSDNNTIDVFNYSQGLGYPVGSMTTIFEYIQAFTRRGRGLIFCAAAGNDNGPINVNTDIASYGYALIIGATQVHDDYFDPVMPNPVEERAHYSNFGPELDVVAPAGGVQAANFDKRRLFTSTIHHCGEFYENSILQMPVVSKVSSTRLRLPNVNGVYVGQYAAIGDKNVVNNFELRRIVTVNSGNNRITFDAALYYTNAIVFNPPLTQSIEIAPLYTTLTAAAAATNMIDVASVKGISTGNKMFFGTLGDPSVGVERTVVNIDAVNNIVEVNANVTAPINSNAVIEPFSTNLTGAVNGTGTCTVTSVEGLFVGGQIIITNFSKPAHIESIVGNTVTVTGYSFTAPLVGAHQLQCVGFGHNSNDFEGTSGATPIVSGVAALVLSGKSTLNVLEVKDIIRRTADQIDAGDPSWGMVDGLDFSNNYGYGRVNAFAAVDMAMNYNHDNRKLKFRDNLGGAAINSPDVWVLPAATPPIVMGMLQESGIGHHVEPNLAVPQTIYVRVINDGLTLQSIKGVKVRCLLAFHPTGTNMDFPFPDSWVHQINNNNQNVIYVGTTDINVFIPANNAAVIPGTPATWNETIVNIPWNPSLPVVDWRTINPNGFDPYLLFHIAPFDGEDAELSLVDLIQNKQLTYKPIAPLFARFTDSADVSYLADKEIQIDPDAGTTIEPFFVHINNVHQNNLDTTYIKATLRHVDPATPDEVVYFKKEINTWSYDPNTVPTWISFQVPTIVNTHVVDYRKLSFECDLFIEKEYSEIVLEIIDDSAPPEVTRATQEFSIILPAAVPAAGIRQPEKQVIHTFTDFTDLVQIHEHAYGPVLNQEAIQYRTCSLFTSATDKLAYAITDGSAFLQEIPGTNTLNLILKPDEQPIVNGLYVKYFVYRGLKRSSYLTAGGAVLAEANVQNNQLLARMWQVKNDWNEQQEDIGALEMPPVNPVPEPLIRDDLGLAGLPANQLPNDHLIDQVFLDHTFHPIVEGWELGEFEIAGAFGFEIIVAYPGFQPTLEEVRSLDHIVNIPAVPAAPIADTITGFAETFAKEKILSYIDPAAYYGLFYNFKIKNHVAAAVNIINGADINNLVIDKFFTKDNIYIDVRNDLGNSINLYDDYKVGAAKAQVDLNGVIVDYAYATWPILKVSRVGLANLSLSLPVGNNPNPILFLVAGNYVGDVNKFKIIGVVGDRTAAFNLEIPADGATIYPSYFKINYNKRYADINAIADPLSNVVINKRSAYDNIFPMNQILPEDNDGGTVWNSLSHLRYLGTTSMQAPNNIDFNVHVGKAIDTIGQTVYAYTPRPMEQNGIDSNAFPNYPIGIENGKSNEVTLLHYLISTALVTTIDVLPEPEPVDFPMIDFISINSIPPVSIADESMENFYSISYTTAEQVILETAMQGFEAEFPIYLVFRDLEFGAGVIKHFRLALQGVTRNAANNTYRTEIIDPATVITCYGHANSTSFFTDAYVKAYDAI